VYRIAKLWCSAELIKMQVSRWLKDFVSRDVFGLLSILLWSCSLEGSEPGWHFHYNVQATVLESRQV